VSNVLYAVEIAIALGLIIFVHELGHFAAAKAFGVWVRRFAIGFGPALLSWKRGETEYSLRAFPLGGFVEPMGEHPDTEGGDDPRALWRRPAWQRATVFAAGVVLNGVLATIFFTVASLIGLNASSPVVGDVVRMLPAHAAGIQAGDRIVAINGEPIQSFEDIMSAVVSEDAGTAFDVTVDRPDAEGGEPERLTFKDIRSRRGTGDPAPRLGIEPALEPVIYAMIPGVPEEQAGLKAGDRILEINRAPVLRFREIDKMLDDAPEGPVTLAVEREGKRLELTIDPATLKLIELGLQPLIAVGGVDDQGPAHKAGVQTGDRIAGIDGQPWPTVERLVEAIKAAGDGGKVRLSLLRDGETLDVTSGVALYGDHPDPRIGITMGPSPAPPVRVGWVDPDGPAAKVGIRPGDTILNVGPKATEPGTWDDVYAAFGSAKGKPVSLRVGRGTAKLTATLTAALVPVEKFRLYGSKPGPVLYEPLPRIYNPLKAAGRGFKRTWLWLGRVYANILQLLKGEVSTESVGGPVLIVQASLGIAERGIGTFIEFWGFLSVCIAVFNFLPVPPFDGGHVLFVIIEKIKGGPVGLKVRTWIWGAGWAAVGVLFILITYQDVARWWVTRM